jgi:hypothetical protein
MVQFDGPHGKLGPGYFYRGARHPPAEPTQRFDGKTVLVTGCNTGVVRWHILFLTKFTTL